MANNVQNIKFLRNGTLFETREAARNALTGFTLTSEKDGTAILARYGSNDDVKTLVGFVYANSSGNKSITIFDVEGASADVDALRTEINNKLGSGVTSANTVTDQLEALSGNSSTDTSATTSVEGAKIYANDLIATLDYTDTAVEGEYVSQVSEADGVIAVTRVALPSASTVSGDSKVVIDVTQDKGAITATAANLTGVKLDGLTVGTDAKIAATDTLGEALANIQAQIDAMDKTADAEDGKVVTTVTEVDGKVTETKANVKDLQLGGYAKTNDTGDILSADTINVALSKLENKASAITIANADGSINVTTGASGTDINVNIKSGEKVLAKDGNAGLYTNIAMSAVTGTELSDLGTNVHEAYKLVATNGDRLGEYIKIYKDSSLINLYLGHVDDLLSGTTAQTEESESSTVVPGTGGEALVWIVQLADGKYKLAAVDVESFLQESEFASGVTANANHVVHGVVDPSSEENSDNNAFLTVGADGFKISGIKDEIAAQLGSVVEGLDADVSGNSTHVTVGVEEADGKITAVTVSESNIANANDLAALSGKAVTEIASSNASISATTAATTDGTVKVDVVTDASKIKMTGFTSTDVLSGITTSSSITEAFEEVDRVITSNEEVTANALNDLNTRVSGISENVDTISGNVSTISGNLTSEIAARKAVDGQNGDTYAANSGKAYISGATSLNDADIKLNDALVALDGDVIKSVKVNNITLTETDNAVNVQITSPAPTGVDNSAITVNTDDQTGEITIVLTDIDAGTYN